MAKTKVKGTIIKQDIATVLTAVAQVEGFSFSGCQDETVDATDLDATKYKEYAGTGYVKPGEFSFDLFLDPSLAGHQQITDDMGIGNKDWQVTYANTGTAEVQDFTSAGTGIEITGDKGDLLKASVTCTLTGDPGWPS